MHSAPTSSYVLVTPTMATEMMRFNNGNRELRQATVDDYARQMKKGLWRISNQGIGFDIDGILFDGQHRLAAIIQSGTAIVLLVVRGCPRDAYQVTDVGLRRTTADRLHVDKRLAEVCNLAGRIFSRERVPSVDVLSDMATIFGPPVSLLLERCNMRTNYFGTAPMRLAAATILLDGAPHEYVLDMHLKLCKHDTEGLAPVGHAMLKHHARDRPRANNTSGCLAHGLYVFDRRHEHFRQVRCDVERAVETVRSIILTVQESLPGISRMAHSST